MEMSPLAPLVTFISRPASSPPSQLRASQLVIVTGLLVRGTVFDVLRAAY
jgi:hypothetical protein